MDYSNQGVFLICVDTWGTGGCSGHYFNAALGEGSSFRDLAMLLVDMEQLLNDRNSPQAFCVLRQFDSPSFPRIDDDRCPARRRGLLATFRIRIRFRRNASWQGTVTWLEKGRTLHFRSALELLGLMGSAVAKQAGPEILPLRMEG